MKKSTLNSIICALVSGLTYGQRIDSAVSGQQRIDSLKKWEISFSINTPENLSTAGYDYNGLTQRIFINGDRKEYTFDVGFGVARKIRSNGWINFVLNYSNYYAYELRDSRIYWPQSAGYELDTLEIQQSSLEFMVGAYYRHSLQKLQFDFGCAFRFKLYSEVAGMTLYSNYTTANNTYDGTQIFQQSQPGGISLGINPNLRISYCFTPRFSAGFKFGSFANYYRTGGAITTKQTNIYSWGGMDTNESITSTQSFHGVRFIPLSASLQLNFSIP